MITIYENNATDSKLKESEAIKESEKPKIEPSDKEGLSFYMEKFVSRHEKKLKREKDGGEAKFQVSEVLGGIARVYERIRTTVEYKGEHVLRRNATERILKRLVWEQESVRSDVNYRRVSETLIKELIWARYLPNNSISGHKVDRVEKIVEKYIYFLKNLDNLPSGISLPKVRSWMWGVASSEIEDVLDPSYRELYVQLMYTWFTSKFEWIDTNINDHDKEVQIYLAIHRAYTKSDESIMRYHLLLKEVPKWKHADISQINQLIMQFPKVYSEIESHLNYASRFTLYRKIQKHAAAFEIFREIVRQEKGNIRDLVKDKSKFEEKIRSVCESKYKQIKQRVSTGIVRSIIYIFLTKVFIALIIEIPYEVILFEEVRYLPLTINILIPPMMMWLVGFSIRVPGAKNTEGIVERLHSVVYESEEKTKQAFSLIKTQKNSSIAPIFGIFYAILFLLVFGSITYALTLLNFTVFGILIFFAFLSLVMLFAFRVRYNANQLKVDSDKEGFIGHLVGYLTLPFLNLGFFLSKGLSKINFFTAILDLLIEVPLKNIIEIFEEWTSFLREKKEEVVELPPE
ncbi:hypothetical protein A2715_06055 [Candidatus Woesebacteria bacterium RIFCSPHIGHO2_01_FULL_39_32]|uniref:Uncharacterized protein n=2 Tax=Candidatus Woeseibacteriota TaxID=1752722 RepID=A0A0G0PQY3_9BACT|nr:MAG: hypothetical protein UT61_C0005G0035 [Candidatus Woesebacteria bacterium GW2011_GWA1_39_8]OGM05378.1 MAG: hypothetical protein A2124_00225 [Candidatus Woesebacteria bacterium GWB1_37_5]OGM25580.1 MAG: hypothetical protein A2715_06055 [Candidatus Woesebacteria bacterium RIFCSPHIGHO2_01_FULL_39_32]OGM36859.1 MAG: hypothetical protein A3F01_00530 [Candidatus Woesebacteria bacterium RIFCSPHIGHO2_12_FULL_38_11]OGM65111.1 MAG: hypothetical protein A2893_05665 [Candidatus Woesebacteria bacteri